MLLGIYFNHFRTHLVVLFSWVVLVFGSIVVVHVLVLVMVPVVVVDGLLLLGEDPLPLLALHTPHLFTAPLKKEDFLI
jgi:hypothetical protein